LNILIIGAGEIGYELAGVLSRESHNVTVLDRSKKRLDTVNENLDVLCFEGNATSANDLVEAGVRDADILVAVTSIDEVNMIASLMSKRLGVDLVIARVRSSELSRPDAPLKSTELGIDVLIHPELSAAHQIINLLKRESASDLVNLADNKMQLIGLQIGEDSPLAGMTMIDYGRQYKQLTFRVVAISRKDQTIIPFGPNNLEENDHIFILAKTEDVSAVIRTTGKPDREIERVMVAGGTPIGTMIVHILSNERKSWNIKLIEPNYDRAEELAKGLDDVLVLHGNPTDTHLLSTEGLAKTDAFISVTKNEDSNIISCLMAKQMDVPKTIAIVSNPDYIQLSKNIGIDAAINQKASASDEIYRHVRRGKVISVKALQDVNAEVLELQAAENSKIIDKPLQEIKLPQGCVVGAILSKSNTIIATGGSRIQPGDRVILFCLAEAIENVTKLFE
jgi:trk system potassium uptake protein TrkA